MLSINAVRATSTNEEPSEGKDATTEDNSIVAVIDVRHLWMHRTEKQRSTDEDEKTRGKQKRKRKKEALVFEE